MSRFVGHTSVVGTAGRFYRKLRVIVSGGSISDKVGSAYEYGADFAMQYIEFLQAKSRLDVRSRLLKGSSKFLSVTLHLEIPETQRAGGRRDASEHRCRTANIEKTESLVYQVLSAAAIRNNVQCMENLQQ